MKDESEIPHFLLFFFRGYFIPNQPSNDPIDHESGKEETESSLTPFSGQFPPVPSLKTKTGDAVTLRLRLLTSCF